MHWLHEGANDGPRLGKQCSLQVEGVKSISEPNDKQGGSSYWMAKRRPTNNNSSKDHDCSNISGDRDPVTGLLIPFPEVCASLMIQRECAVYISSGWGHGRRVKGAARWEGNEMEGCLVLLEPTGHCIECVLRTDRRAPYSTDVREVRHSIEA